MADTVGQDGWVTGVEASPRFRVQQSESNWDIIHSMKMSARKLRDKCLATGKVHEAGIDAYGHFADDVNGWGLYDSTIGVIAQLPHTK